MDKETFVRIEGKLNEVNERTIKIETTLDNADVVDMRAHVNFIRKLPKVFMWSAGFIGALVGIYYKFSG